MERKKLPGANKNNHFYLRDATKEGLKQPIHVHFDSYEPALKMGNKTLDNLCSFFVTVDSPEFSPRGLTCRVNSINHKRSSQGVINGVIAHVNMVRYEDDCSIERVYVQLLEDGRVVGQLVADGTHEEITKLDGVFFMAGDAVYLDGMGNAYDSIINLAQLGSKNYFWSKKESEWLMGSWGLNKPNRRSDKLR